MGVSEEDIARAMRQAPEPEPFGVWEENWRTWRIFLHLADQWHYTSGMTGSQRIGGPPASEIEATARMMGVPRHDREQLLEDIKGMVWTVLEVDRIERA